MLKLLGRILGSDIEHSINAPNHWEEVTTELFQRIAKEWDGADQVKIFSILTRQDYTAIRETKDKNLEAVFWITIKFMYEQIVPWQQLKRPEFFTVAGKTVRVPTKIGKLSLGQNIALRNAMIKVDAGLSPESVKWMSQKDFIYDETIAYAIAVYLQPIIDGGEFDDERAEQIEREILAMPIIRTYAIGFFLLSRAESYGLTLAERLRRMGLIWLRTLIRKRGKRMSKRELIF